MDYRITGLPAAHFSDLFGLDDAALARRGARRMIADALPGYPCRITLEDAEPGEPVILLHWTHLDVDTPYRGGGPIFVREAARAHFDAINRVPLQLSRRILSVRAFDAAGWMRHGRVVQGEALEALTGEMFADGEVAYLHVHNAGRGCYAARIDRA
jgi:hypothetical protein